MQLAKKRSLAQISVNSLAVQLTLAKTEIIQGIPAFRDFTIRDPRYFVILFWALFLDFEEKNPKKKFFRDFFFSENFFGIFLLFILLFCRL